MERPAAKLADLKLVSKYYPVSNYSYPRPDAPLHRHDVSEGRSSVGSDCSAPGMIEDHESDVSAEEYHTAGSELWDSFWQAKNGEEQRRSQYPALIPSPGPRKTLGDFVEENPRIADQDDHQTRSRTQSRGSDDMPSWPLPPTPVSATLPTPEPSTMSKPAATEQPKPRQLEQHQQQKFITPKASYSLFPTPANNSHRQPLPHRVSQEEIRQSFYQAWHPDLAASFTAKHFKPTSIYLPSGNASGGTQSAPVTPSYPMFAPPINRPITPNPPSTNSTFSTSNTTSHQQLRQARSVATLRARASTVSSAMPSSSAPLRAMPANNTRLTSYPPPPPTPVTAGFPARGAPAYLDASTIHRPRHAEKDNLPPPVSVFDFDSDDEDGGKGLAKRIKRGLHRPSVSEGHHGHHHQHGGGGKTGAAAASEREQLRRAPVLKKQRSEVFARMLGRKSSH